MVDGLTLKSVGCRFDSYRAHHFFSTTYQRLEKLGQLTFVSRHKTLRGYEAAMFAGFRRNPENLFGFFRGTFWGTALVKLRLATNLRRVCINELQES